MQPNNIISLEAIQIAKPCRADWQNMTGDERARFCGSCHKNVYDISRMTRAQAHYLIAEKEGDLCLRLHRRPDGTVITSDCPVGQAAAPRPLWWGIAALAALMSATLAGCAATGDAAKPETIALADGATRQSIAALMPTPTAIHVETPPMNFDHAEPTPITNHAAPTEQFSGVTMGVPMPPPPQATPISAPTPLPNSQYPAATRTMGRILVPAPTDEAN